MVTGNKVQNLNKRKRLGAIYVELCLTVSFFLKTALVVMCLVMMRLSFDVVQKQS